MDRKNPGKCYPLELIKKVTNTVPGIWEKIDEAHKRNAEQNNSQWPEWCYIPFGDCMDLVFDMYEVNPTNADLVNYGRLVSILISLAPWRVSKEIYAMDPDIEQILSEQTDVKVDPEILMKLPYYCFYVKTSFLSLDPEKDLDGFFVSLEYNHRDNSTELRVTFLYTDLTCLEIPLLLKYKTLEETIDYLLDLAETEPSVKREPGKKKRLENSFGDLRNTMVSALQMVLYILSVNSDVEEDPVQKKIYRPSPSAGAGKVPSTRRIKDKYSEVRMWDVGYRIGASVRANKQRRESSAGSYPGSHSSKRPHIRRGHWHNFWVGSKKKEEGIGDGKGAERRLVLKWIPPTFVGGGKAVNEDMPVVYHEVKK